MSRGQKSQGSKSSDGQSREKLALDERRDHPGTCISHFAETLPVPSLKAPPPFLGLMADMAYFGLLDIVPAVGVGKVDRLTRRQSKREREGLQREMQHP